MNIILENINILKTKLFEELELDKWIKICIRIYFYQNYLK
jgi:hypothetical protein